MNLQKMFKPFVLLIAVLVTGTSCFAQKQTLVGLSITGEHARSSFADINLGTGATIERQFSKHYALETGLYYRTVTWRELVFVDGAAFSSQKYRQQYVSLPVLYKFKSSILNVSFGPTLDCYIGWRTTGHHHDGFDAGNIGGNTLSVGVMGKLGKTFAIGKQLLLEPEIRYNPIFSDQSPYSGKRSFYGGAVSVKYVFRR